MEVGKHFKSPSTEEGVSIKSAPPSSTKVSFSPEDGQLKEEVIELKLSDARKKANELWEKYWEQVKAVMDAEKVLQEKLMVADKMRAAKLEIEVELGRVNTHIEKLTKRVNELQTDVEKAKKEMIALAKIRDTFIGKSVKSQNQFQYYEHLYGLQHQKHDNKDGDSKTLIAEIEKLKEDAAALKERLKAAEKDYKAADKERLEASKTLEKAKKEEGKQLKEANKAELKAKEEEGKY